MVRTSHIYSSKDCKKLNEQTNGANIASEGEMETTLAAGVSQLASPPLLRTANKSLTCIGTQIPGLRRI